MRRSLVSRLIVLLKCHGRSDPTTRGRAVNYYWYRYTPRSHGVGCATHARCPQHPPTPDWKTRVRELAQRQLLRETQVLLFSNQPRVVSSLGLATLVVAFGNWFNTTLSEKALPGPNAPRLPCIASYSVQGEITSCGLDSGQNLAGSLTLSRGRLV